MSERIIRCNDTILVAVPYDPGQRFCLVMSCDLCYFKKIPCEIQNLPPCISYDREDNQNIYWRIGRRQTDQLLREREEIMKARPNTIHDLEKYVKDIEPKVSVMKITTSGKISEGSKVIARWYASEHYYILGINYGKGIGGLIEALLYITKDEQEVTFNIELYHTVGIADSQIESFAVVYNCT
jgi:hypothetical protein